MVEERRDVYLEFGKDPLIFRAQPKDSKKKRNESDRRKNLAPQQHQRQFVRLSERRLRERTWKGKFDAETWSQSSFAIGPGHHGRVPVSSFHLSLHGRSHFANKLTAAPITHPVPGFNLHLPRPFALLIVDAPCLSIIPSTPPPINFGLNVKFSKLFVNTISITPENVVMCTPNINSIKFVIILIDVILLNSSSS
ncbi:hypothetical protein V1478_005994 [Vespula squamosa]|uniref:Uncharacterized protein n=1 Tax=Vespula squamosa TaxID=30214 RepID=A0ABD2B931_VESSQ